MCVCTTNVFTMDFSDVRLELRTDFMMHDGVKRAIAEHADKTFRPVSVEVLYI